MIACLVSRTNTIDIRPFSLQMKNNPESINLKGNCDSRKEIIHFNLKDCLQIIFNKVKHKNLSKNIHKSYAWLLGGEK